MLTRLVSSLSESNKEDFKSEPHVHLRVMPLIKIVVVLRLPVQPLMAAKSLSQCLVCWLVQFSQVEGRERASEKESTKMLRENRWYLGT